MRSIIVAVFVGVVACGSDPAASSAGTDTADPSPANDAPTSNFKSSNDALRSRVTGFNPADHYRETDVNPADIDPTVTQAFAAHQAFYPRTPPIGELVVFFAGTNGAPGHEDGLMATVADLGFHGIDLSYPTGVAAEAACGTDINCYAGYRAEMFTGTDDCPSIQVGPQDAIHDRLVGLINYLVQARPRQGWDAFLGATGDLNYGSIVFTGLSQGGGHAAWVGVHHDVHGVVMFSSVVDSNHQVSPAIPATWVTQAHKTSVDRYYGFDHDQDYVRAAVEVNWPALGMDVFGGRTPTDGVAPPYGGSHELSSAIPMPDGKTAHGSVVTDASTPRNPDGSPVYAPVWSYMFGALR